MSATVEIEQGRIGESESNHTKTCSELSQGLKPQIEANACGTAEAVPFQSIDAVNGCQSSVAGCQLAEAGESQKTHPSKSGLGGAPGKGTADPSTRTANDRADLAQDDKAVGKQGIPHIPKDGICGPPTGLGGAPRRIGESDEEENELELSEDSCETDSETGPELTDEKAEEIRAFILQEPPSEVPNTAQEKRLAAKRQKIEDQLGVIHQIGALIDNPSRRFRLTEGRKTYKVSVRELLMRRRLKIRNKNGRLVQFKVNAAQRDYAKTAAKKNIVLKARQLGFTSYVAARFFLNCIARPGTVRVQVAHDQHSAEQIFRIVHRMLANLPDYLRKGVLATSHANKRQIIFPHIDAVAGKDIVDPAKFQDGLGKVIDGVVQCLNSSAWSKTKSA